SPAQESTVQTFWSLQSALVRQQVGSGTQAWSALQMAQGLTAWQSASASQHAAIGSWTQPRAGSQKSRVQGCPSSVTTHAGSCWQMPPTQWSAPLQRPSSQESVLSATLWQNPPTH